MMKRIQKPSYWQEIAKRWRKIPPPQHPWPSEVKIYQKFSQRALRRINKPRILILGATPEMRDIAHSFKDSEITCVDIDIDMILAMKELMKYKKKADQEIWIRADWLTVPLRENYFHLILGESVLPNIKFPLWSKFLRHLNNLLGSNGCFVTRVVMVVSSKSQWLNKSLNGTFQYVKKNKLNSEELRFLLFTRIWHPKVKAMGDKDIFQSVKKFWREKKGKFCHPDSYIQKLLNQIKENYNWPPKYDYQWSNRTKEVSEEYLKRYFKIIGLKYGKGEAVCPVSYHPIYLLKKK